MRKATSELMAELRELYGNRCFYCGSKMYLQFAHLQPTKLKGMSRGSRKRYYDIKNNPGKYELLCKECHKSLDSGERFYFSNAIFGREYGFDIL